ncbi:MAG: hypothetical protein ACI9W1_003470, partial [Candidatus Azotimanducaceae bacterium]
NRGLTTMCDCAVMVLKRPIPKLVISLEDFVLTEIK